MDYIIALRDLVISDLREAEAISDITLTYVDV